MFILLEYSMNPHLKNNSENRKETNANKAFFRKDEKNAINYPAKLSD